MNKAAKIFGIAAIGCMLAGQPALAQDSAKSMTTTTTTDRGTTEDKDDHGKWGLAGLLGLLGLLGLRKRDEHHHVEVHKRPNV